MKIIYTILAFCVFATAKTQNYVKPSSFGIHYSLTDFETAEQIKATSLNNVLKNKLWSKPPQMMSGFGIDYLKGITKHLDFVADFNFTNGTDAYNLPTTNTINYSLFTLDAVLNLKLLSDKYYVRPYLIAGAGVYNQMETGLYAPLGLGFQFNIFNEAIANIQMEYRTPFKNADNPNLFYQIGFATALSKKKTKHNKIPTKKNVAIPEQKLTPTDIKPISKTLLITVYDEATMQPLPLAEITIVGSDGKTVTAISSSDGNAIFNNIQAGNYTVKGQLNKVDAIQVNINKESFDTAVNQINVSLLHNDPRFTLQGYAIDKATGKPVGNAVITVTNTMQSATKLFSSNENDGSFSVQLEGGSDFKISGKKAGFISNIEKMTTKGLNRSTTLYVKLELGIEEAKVGQAIILNKIYFETGKAVINTAASGDLDKLVQFLKDNPSTKLQILGFTDNVGSQEKNYILSQNRANSVVAYLIKNGIEQNRLSAKGYGTSQPVADNATADGRAQNRRVEMEVIQ